MMTIYGDPHRSPSSLASIKLLGKEVAYAGGQMSQHRRDCEIGGSSSAKRRREVVAEIVVLDELVGAVPLNAQLPAQNGLSLRRA